MKTYLPILLFFLISPFALAQVELEKYNNAATNEEYIDLLTDDLQSLNRFVRLFSKDEEEPRTPSEVAPLKLTFNQRDYEAHIEEITKVNIQFSDFMTDGFITLNLVKDPAIYSSLEDIKAPIYVKKVYYHDGTTQTITDKTNINTYFSAELALTKAVDKIDVELAFSTVKQVDSIVLPAKVHQKVTYRGVAIEVVEVSDKSVLLKIASNELEFDEIQALLKNKKRVSSYRSQRSGMHPDKFDLFLREYLKEIEAVLTFSKANMEMDHAEFKRLVEVKLSKLESQWSGQLDQSTGASYLYYEFGEPIDQIVMYSNRETFEKNVTKTLLNQTPKSRFVTHQDNKTLIYNSDLKLIKEFPDRYSPINDYYFETDLQYFYLNDKLEMQPLTYYNVSNVLNNYVIIQEDDESPLELVDATNTKLMKVDSFEICSAYNCALIASGDSYYLLNNTSLAPQKIANVDQVLVAEKGYFVVKKKEKYGFMNAEGKIVVPIQYDEVNTFSDMIDFLPTDLLFAVKQNDKWGFVDLNNKTVIPFMYSDVSGPFSYGLAPVYLDDALGLINLKNEKVSKFVNRNYAQSSNFGKRTMSLSDGTYNYKGEKEKED
ncbi:WG repeat-containing protein [Myroides odoratus]|uniref:WG repeat-containing protein n=1 Tax=Myroides odoratus TaxID=256 RepID=UPI0039AEB4A1